MTVVTQEKRSTFESGTTAFTRDGGDGRWVAADGRVHVKYDPDGAAVAVGHRARQKRKKKHFVTTTGKKKRKEIVREKKKTERETRVRRFTTAVPTNPAQTGRGRSLPPRHSITTFLLIFRAE